ncbi:MAG TPA: hypothetical protein VLE97_06150 [Gaiellaceae bacterium]|nr:hypothetical protein [Gaiellaceae bacterium]
MGRTRAKRLRGYGNAIVLPLATLFVESVIDAFADAADALGVASAAAAAVHVPEAPASVSVVNAPPAVAAVPEENAA